MSDNVKNNQLDDEQLESISGGSGEEFENPVNSKFQPGDSVTVRYIVYSPPYMDGTTVEKKGTVLSVRIKNGKVIYEVDVTGIKIIDVEESENIW
ncbi:MAG: hypothetical protein ACI4KB_07750 [Oscillospiraceae bacterium]|nr:hypothetical protein [Oscillospiraceae bacterium]